MTTKTIEDIEVGGMWFQPDHTTCHTQGATLNVLHENSLDRIFACFGGAIFKFAPGAKSFRSVHAYSYQPYPLRSYKVRDAIPLSIYLYRSSR